MYTSCIFCNGPLGTNEAVERFPVGRRIAYDQSTGRLWVVCSACERWNLSPLETRWEAIEDAERLFRAAPLKVTGENISMAQTREGLELVRIGAPPKVELMAWRYGDQFGRRRRRRLATTGVALTALGASSAISFASIAGIAVGSQLIMAGSLVSTVSTFGLLMTMRRGAPRLLVRGEREEVFRLTLQDARLAALVPRDDGSWHLELPHTIVIGQPGKGAQRAAKTTLTGHAAHVATSRLLPYLNRGGGSRRSVLDAMDVIDRMPSVDQLMRDASRNTEASRTHFKVPVGKSNIGVLPDRYRLAMEMALHEDDERRAMEGELAELEARWREADALAKIADDLMLPSGVQEELAQLRHRRPE